MKRIVILGSTGSIGRQTLDVVRSLPGKFKVVGLGAGNNWRLLAEQVREFRPLAAALSGEKELESIKDEMAPDRVPELFLGRGGLETLASLPEADLVVVAVTGTAGIYPTIAAIRAGKDIALANKETLVAAGRLVMELSARYKTGILPIDSEHSAVWQCLHGCGPDQVKKIILTASGGPFRQFEPADLESVTADMALRHPNWHMGNKVTIDSATLMNKGLEVIEAKWLFGVNYSEIEVVVHPQSVIHSAVEFLDGSILAQLGLPDMRLPIQYALTYPDRVPGAVPRLKFTDLQGLTFEPPDLEKFSSLRLAYEAGRVGGTMTAVLNAANEVAVESFLGGTLSFRNIPFIVESVMEKHESLNNPALSEIMAADNWARESAKKHIKGLL